MVMNRLPTVVSALAVLFVTTPLVAQRAAPRVTTSGVVTDQSSNHAVVGALVEFPALRRSAITDVNGRFTLRDMKPGRHKMVVSQLGYRTFVKEQQIIDDDVLMIFLDPDPVLVRGLEVQIDRLAERRKMVAVSVQSFVRNELLSFAANSAADFVRTRLMIRPCANGRGSCLLSRGSLVQPVVYIDERRAFGLEELEMYPTFDIYMVESYDHGRMVRVYTNWYVSKMARSNSPLQNIIIW
jgi:hypothetical protein